jgi:meso-butanediol dehydrogenase / (S,S)-butanediol dehydrogenase / diacetyl reductase
MTGQRKVITVQGLSGKVAIVTGATRTMGEAIAKRLAREGAAVVGFGRSSELGRAIADGINADGGRAAFIAGDVTKPDDVRAAVEAAVTTFGRLDIVVNNAAAVELIREGLEGSIVGVHIDTFEQQLRVGLHGPFLLARAAIPHMLQNGGGSFVSVSSHGGHRAFPGLSGYGPTKAAVEALTRQIAADFGAQGIRANSVVLGSIRVSQNEHVHDDPDMGQALRDMQMLSNVAGLPEDIAAAVTFLASDEAKFITGVSLPVDGGLLAKAPMVRSAFEDWMDKLSSHAHDPASQPAETGAND